MGKPIVLSRSYDIFHLISDLVGLVNALGSEPTVIVGHDWGAWVKQFAALLRPNLFRAVGLLSVPFLPRLSISPSEREQQKYPSKMFYRQMLRAPGSEKVFEADLRSSIINNLYTASGEAPPDRRFRFVFDPQDVASMAPPSIPKKPSFVTDDIDFIVGEFQRTGAVGGVNYYRNVDHNWAMTPFLDGANSSRHCSSPVSVTPFSASGTSTSSQWKVMCRIWSERSSFVALAIESSRSARRKLMNY
jgi:pimeloyl-ACP methyl ester carboxylesterase